MVSYFDWLSLVPGIDSLFPPLFKIATEDEENYSEKNSNEENYSKEQVKYHDNVFFKRQISVCKFLKTKSLYPEPQTGTANLCRLWIIINVLK